MLCEILSLLLTPLPIAMELMVLAVCRRWREPAIVEPGTQRHVETRPVSRSGGFIVVAMNPLVFVHPKVICTDTIEVVLVV